MPSRHLLKKTDRLAGVDQLFMNASRAANTVFVTSPVSKGAINERRGNRTEEL